MFHRLSSVVFYGLSFVLVYAYHFNGMDEVFPYLLLTLITGGISHIITEVRERNSEVLSISMSEDAVKEMLRNIRKQDDEGDD